MSEKYIEYSWIFNIHDKQMVTESYSNFVPFKLKYPDTITKEFIEKELTNYYEIAKSLETSLYESYDNIMYGYEIFINTILSKKINSEKSFLNVRCFRNNIGAELHIRMKALDSNQIQNQNKQLQ